MLRSLKITDDDGRVSLTNVSLYLVLALFAYVVVRSGEMDPTALGALLTALAAYRGKMWAQDKREERTETRETDRLRSELAEARKALEYAQRGARTSSTAAPLPSGLAR